MRPRACELQRERLRKAKKGGRSYSHGNPTPTEEAVIIAVSPCEGCPGVKALHETNKAPAPEEYSDLVEEYVDHL